MKDRCTRSRIRNHKGEFTPTAGVKAEVRVNPVSVRLVRQVDLAHRVIGTLPCARYCVIGGREHIFFNVCLFFFPTVSEYVVQMPSCSPFSAGATGRCTWGVVVIHQGFGFGRFGEWEGCCNTEPTVRASVRSEEKLPSTGVGAAAANNRDSEVGLLGNSRPCSEPDTYAFQPL